MSLEKRQPCEIAKIPLLREQFHSEWLEFCSREPETVFMTLVKNDTEIGHVVYRRLKSSRFSMSSGIYISILVTTPEVRRQGVAKEIVKRLMELEKETSIFFTLSMDGSQGFWSKIGFTEVEDLDLRSVLLPGEDEINKRLPLMIHCC